MEQLREQTEQIQQQNDLLNRKLERLKGDHQLVGEENNQLHHMLRLRDQELEKLRQQTEELDKKISDMKKPEVSVSPEEMEMLHSFEDMPTPMEQGSDTEEKTDEPAEFQAEIPSFNLAEQIMAEHRRVVASQRQAPARQSQTDRKEAIQHVVSQFVNSPDPAQEAVAQAMPTETIAAAAETSEPLDRPGSESSMTMTTSDGLIADIVRRDIMQFLETKKQAFQKTDWMWKNN
jgi:uncharacterized phage infection (PIP) family protein YhgE